MTIETDLNRIAVALESIASCMLARPFGGEPSTETPTAQPDLTGVHQPDHRVYDGASQGGSVTPAAPPQPTAAPTRTRRTKAQIEADKQAEAARILAAMQAQVAGAAAPVVAPVVAPQVAVAGPVQSFTLADFRPRFVKLADAGKRDDLIALIKSLGGAMLTDIKPEQYNALHAGLVKLEGGHV